MPTTQQTFLVTSATGVQGGAVVAHLLQAGHRVHALVRDATKPAALALQAQGAALFVGDFDNQPAIRAAVAGCTGVFLNTWPAGDEPRQAANVLDAAAAAGVRCVVCSTVTGAEDWESFPFVDGNEIMTAYWRGKAGVQERVQAAGIAHWTILQPAWLMTNFVTPNASFYWPGLAQGRLRAALKPGARAALTDPAQVGEVAARVLLNPGDARWAGRVLRIAGEALDIEEIADRLGQVAGREVAVEYVPQDEIEARVRAEPMVWSHVFVSSGYGDVNLEQVRGLGVQVVGFEEFLMRNKDAVAAAVGSA